MNEKLVFPELIEVQILFSAHGFTCTVFSQSMGDTEQSTILTYFCCDHKVELTACVCLCNESS